MNKLFTVAFAAAMVGTTFAQEAAKAEENNAEAPKVTVREESAKWPVFFAVSEFPNSPDVIGLRLTIPFSTIHDSVTGVDCGIWGKSLYFEGIAVNVLRNNVVDSAAGFQVSLYNTIGRGDLMGLQVGLWNEAMSLRGVQCGLVNTVGEGEGLQVGIINRAETFSGYQFGLINVIRDAELQFFPLVNIGF